jgi:predicted PhzF superfamily epimerase YddE/YHI9
MTLPRRKGKAFALGEQLKKALNIQPQEVYKSRDIMLVYKDQQSVENIEIDRAFFDQIDLGTGGIIITAPGLEVDFVSRFFTPQASILEDPVTGSAHCTLVPYWSERLNRKRLLAKQLSERGGELTCEDHNQNVIISGRAATYSKGVLTF